MVQLSAVTFGCQNISQSPAEWVVLEGVGGFLGWYGQGNGRAPRTP